MEFQPASQISVVLFSVFSILMFWLCYLGIRTTSSWKKWLGLLVGLIAIFTIVGISGLATKNFLPIGPILFALIFVYSFAFSFSKSGGEISRTLPITFLIGFQSFRLPLELILHQWVADGTIPETMTWTDQNWDIVSGILSLLAIPFVKKNKEIAIIVNVVGFALLLNVLRVVILSAPLPFSWKLDTPLLLIAYSPYNLIGPLFVMPALIGHLLTFRKLLLTL